MWFASVSIFPDWFEPLVKTGITGRANTNGIVSYRNVNPRDFTTDNYKRVDHRPYGGGAGMVMMPEPLSKALKYAKALAKQDNLNNVCTVYMSPQGKTLTESDVVSFANKDIDGFILLCGRYDGVDERIIENYVDLEISLGDFVLSGGELAAMVFMDCIIRKLPNVMGDDNSVVYDSFVDGLLDYPQYTKPSCFEEKNVPAVLKSGNHADIKKWRFLKQYENTTLKRPDLIADFEPSEQQAKWLETIRKN